MKVDLLAHNQEAYGKIKSLIAEGRKKLAISHATGTGKSYLVAKLFEDYSNDKKLVLAPSRYIKEQMQGLFDKYSIQNVDIILYQKLIKMPDEDIAAMDYQVIALDEYHHDAATKVWGEKVELLINSHPESIIFGTSATPIKTDGVNAIDELFEGNCASDLPLSESIARKIVPLPKYVGALYTLDDELERLRKKVENATNSKEEKKEFYKKINAMRSQIEKSYGMPIILNKHIKDKEGKYIVFCKNKKHLDEIKDTVIGWFHTAGCKDIHSYVVHSSYEGKDKEYKAFCDDTSHTLKLLFCVDMLNEGLHLENISGVLLLRPTRSSIVWHQQIGRAIEANNTNTPVIIDAVNNFSSIGQGMGLLKEIKDAVAREKEGDPEFDDSDFMDIDTFFVLENVIEIQEMFKEIEGRLKGSWDLYIKALTQYKEREGDCLVSSRHIEVVDGVSVKLGTFCLNVRSGQFSLTDRREEQLKELNFIFDTVKYKFERKVSEIAEYYQKYKKLPSNHSVDIKIKSLGIFLVNERAKYNKNGEYPEWKQQIIERELPEFSYEKSNIVSFKRFINYAKLYKKKNGHLNIKKNDVMDDGYRIGMIFSGLKQRYKNGMLNDDKIKQLEKLGLYIDSKFNKQFNEKMELARQAVTDDVKISTSNQFYNGINLYTWIKYTINKKYRNNELSSDEIAVIENLVGKPLNRLFNNGNFVRIVDVINKEEIAICNTQNKIVKIMQKKYQSKISVSTISNLLNGKAKKPYKGRFMFYYATDEEVKKYLSDNKVS